MERVVHTIEILRPTGKEKHAEEVASSSGVASLEGKTVGFLDNGKHNFDVFLGRVKARLLSEHRIANVMICRKANVASSAGSMIEELAVQCHVVLTGSCD